MHEKLYEIFLNVNDLLKFAETKNSGLIVLCSGLIIGLAAIFKDVQENINKHVLFAGVLSFIIAISLSLLSFFPTLSNHTDVKYTEVKNLYFFGELCKADAFCLEKELKSIDQSYVPTRFDRDLMNQIIVNSNITMHKMAFFKWALIFCFGGILIFMTAIAARYWRR